MLERDHRRDDHGRRLNRRLGQDVSSKPRLITPNHHIGQLGWLKLTVPAHLVSVTFVASGRGRHSLWEADNPPLDNRRSRGAVLRLRHQHGIGHV